MASFYGSSCANNGEGVLKPQGPFISHLYIMMRMSSIASRTSGGAFVLFSQNQSWKGREYTRSGHQSRKE
eukprot:4662796-Pyramimonas_sp.AAC.1